MMFWSITLIVSLKYVSIVLRFDNARRRRHPRAARARLAPDARSPATCLDGGDARHLRRFAVLRRRDHHARDLGAFRGGRLVGGHARLRALGGAAHHRDPGRAVRDPEPRHRSGRPAVRPDHGALVHRAGDARRDFDRADALGARGARPALRARFRGALARPHLPRARRGVPRADRRRSAVRRHGPFRAGPDPHRVVRAGVPLADAQLLRPGRARAARPGGDEEPVLPARAAGTADADGAACHRCDRDRVAGDDLGRVLGDAAGLAPRLPAAPADAAHLGNGARADLHSAGELDHAGAGDPAGAGVQVLQRDRLGLRHRGFGHDGARPRR